MRALLAILCFSITTVLSGQHVADFENIDLSIDAFNNGSDGSGGFSSGSVFLPNTYDSSFDAWHGFAISATTDVDSPGFGNQYSSRTGSGNNGSQNYAVGFAIDQLIIKLEGEAAGKVMEGFYYTNNAYAYWSMKDGDAFAKKFGGADGNDKDFFFVTIKKYLNGTLSIDSINIYLADYRFNNNNNDYILDTWRYVDVSSLGGVDSLQLTFTSSDVGAFGINTPTYICLDDITTTDVSNVESISKLSGLSISPNPTTNYVRIAGAKLGDQYQIRDMSGRLIENRIISSEKINTSHLQNGTYSLLLFSERDMKSFRFVKI